MNLSVLVKVLNATGDTLAYLYRDNGIQRKKSCSLPGYKMCLSGLTVLSFSCSFFLLSKKPTMSIYNIRMQYGRNNDIAECNWFLLNFRVNFIQKNKLSLSNKTRGPGTAQWETFVALQESRLDVTLSSKQYSEFSVNYGIWGDDAIFGTTRRVQKAINRTNGLLINSWIFLIGPIFIPGDGGRNPNKTFLPNVFHVASALWPLEIWHREGWKNVIGALPNPLDIARFHPSPPDEKHGCLLLIKRKNQLRSYLLQLLEEAEAAYRIPVCHRFVYGNYSKSDFLRAAKWAKFAVISHGTETQGYALLELMALNVSLFVVDDNYEYVMRTKRSKVVPWFSQNETGMVFTADGANSSDIITRMRSNFYYFLERVDDYNPHRYIETRFSRERFVADWIELLCQEIQLRNLRGCDVLNSMSTKARTRCVEYASAKHYGAS